MTITTTRIVALGLAAALTVSAAPSFAAPVLGSTATLKQANPAQTTQVQWRRHRGGGAALAAGAAAGFIAGAAIASAAQPRYYDPAYSYGYAYAPAPSYYYAEPSYTYAPSYAGEPVAPYGYTGRACKSDGNTGGVGFDVSSC